ncbi:hypothetical protein [Desulforamulus ruminis]|uniref:Uncharacterized protein n=1 Tax=Desulforamulus ruminis (strain ATCC 23193 / DSM 2154 / NCIMB 8452 / DL) TaxID=696281 RepID=F6DK45_DESRL|nr:hypothetical protein [Desulforamulus ruminis]AEG60359.1 hypothetical protein Desru_2108 [Desulforamulus ruminis DSM 2154]
MLKGLEVIKVKFVGIEGLPVWSILHFLERTCLNHLKLVTIQRICELSAEGYPDGCFSVASSSAEIFPGRSFLHKQPAPAKLIVLTEKAESPADFWNVIRNFKRPMVYFTEGNHKIPLYDFTYEEAARIWSFKEQSPPVGEIIGAGGALLDLLYAAEREEREKDEHINRQIGQTAENIDRMVRASQTIASAKTPDGIKVYAESILKDLMQKQSQLNKKIGIHNQEIDTNI